MTRYEATKKAYDEGKLDIATYGQIAANEFSTKIIVRATVRGWITEDTAAEILDADNDQ